MNELNNALQYLCEKRAGCSFRCLASEVEFQWKRNEYQNNRQTIPKRQLTSCSLMANSSLISPDENFVSASLFSAFVSHRVSSFKSKWNCRHMEDDFSYRAYLALNSRFTAFQFTRSEFNEASIESISSGLHLLRNRSRSIIKLSTIGEILSIPSSTSWKI